MPARAQSLPPKGRINADWDIRRNLMLIIKLLENEGLRKAEFALKQANSENIIGLCEAYLKLLSDYRDEIYKLREIPEINPQKSSSLARELVNQSRRILRSALENTTSERNKTESLLKSFTAISGYEAVKTLNRLGYRGFKEWELRANQIRLAKDDTDEKFTIAEGVSLAGELRRKAYISYKTTFFEEQRGID
jgi:hypothetical protein